MDVAKHGQKQLTLDNSIHFDFLLVQKPKTFGRIFCIMRSGIHILSILLVDRCMSNAGWRVNKENVFYFFFFEKEIPAFPTKYGIWNFQSLSPNLKYPHSQLMGLNLKLMGVF